MPFMLCGLGRLWPIIHPSATPFCVQATEGWTAKAMQRAAEDMNLSPVFAGVCDGKEKDLVEHFIRSCNQQLFARLREAGPEFTALSTADKIKLAVRWRLEMIAPHVSAFLLFTSLHCVPLPHATPPLAL